MSALPSPSSAAERERGLAWCRAVANATLESVRGTMSFEGNPFAIAERLIPAVVPVEEEVVGWTVLNVATGALSRLCLTEELVEDCLRSHTTKLPHRVCKVVAVAETPDPAPSGNVYRVESGKVMVYRRDEERDWVECILTPTKDIPHVAELMGVGK